jgi:hypothetical protein
MLRLAVDLRPLLEPFESGVTQYTKAVVRGLLKRDDGLDLYYQARTRCKRIHELFPSVRHLTLSNTRFHVRALLEFPSLPSGYFLEKPDLIWIPDRRPFYKTSIPVVMTIHDKVPELYARLLLKSRLWHRISLCEAVKIGCGVVVPLLRWPVRWDALQEVTYEGLLCKMKEPSLGKSFEKLVFL